MQRLVREHRPDDERAVAALLLLIGCVRKTDG